MMSKLFDALPKPIHRDHKKMNKTELRYVDEILEPRKMLGEIKDYIFEPFGMRLGPNIHYHPDFLVIFETHFEIHEVKGFWRDDARAKIKVATALYPWFKFVAIQYKKKQWHYEEFYP